VLARALIVVSSIFLAAYAGADGASAKAKEPAVSTQQGKHSAGKASKSAASKKKATKTRAKASVKSSKARKTAASKAQRSKSKVTKSAQKTKAAARKSASARKKAAAATPKPAVEAAVSTPGKMTERRARFLPIAGRIKPEGLPLTLVDAVITRESRYDPKARGSLGEIGLMQLMPATARSLARQHGFGDVADLPAAQFAAWLEKPENNMRLGMKYLSMCHKKAKQNVAATIGCYNAGPGNMWAWKSIGHTRRYVSFVNEHLASN